MEKLKDRTEGFDDIFPCRSHGARCKLKQISIWINLFWLYDQPEYKNSFIKEIKETMKLN